VLLSGLIAHAILAALYIVLNTPTQLIALRFLEGITVSAERPAVAAYVADVTPEEHRSEAYGGLAVALNAGMLVGPFVGGLIGQYSGFAAAFAVNVVIEVLAVLLVAGRIRGPVVHESPHASEESPVSWKDMVSIPLIGAYASFFATSIAMAILGSLWSIWVRGLGGSYTYIGATFTVFALPQILIGARAGRVGDQLGRAPVLLGAGALVSLMYASYGFVTNLTAIMVLGIVEGIAVVFLQPVAQGLLADASPVRARGRAQGLAGTVGSVGGAAAAFASLPLYHASRGSPFLIAAAVTIAGCGIAAYGASVYSRRRRTSTQVSRSAELEVT